MLSTWLCACMNGRAVNLLVLFPGEPESLQVGLHPRQGGFVGEVRVAIVISILGRFGVSLEEGLRAAVGDLGVEVAGPGLFHGGLGGRDVPLLRGGLEPFVLGVGGREIGLGDQ